jgi:type II secretory pathway pseudopilin PulG
MASAVVLLLVAVVVVVAFVLLLLVLDKQEAVVAVISRCRLMQDAAFRNEGRPAIIPYDLLSQYCNSEGFLAHPNIKLFPTRLVLPQSVMDEKKDNPN